MAMLSLVLEIPGYLCGQQAGMTAIERGIVWGGGWVGGWGEFGSRRNPRKYLCVGGEWRGEGGEAAIRASRSPFAVQLKHNYFMPDCVLSKALNRNGI